MQELQGQPGSQWRADPVRWVELRADPFALTAPGLALASPVLACEVSAHRLGTTSQHPLSSPPNSSGARPLRPGAHVANPDLSSLFASDESICFRPPPRKILFPLFSLRHQPILLPTPKLPAMQLRPGAAALRDAVAGRVALPACALCRQPLVPNRGASQRLWVRQQQQAGLHSSSRRDSAWAAAVQVASNVVGSAVKSASKDGSSMAIDPLRTVAKEMQFLTGNIRKLLGSGHPSLDRVAKYYTQAEGKHMRPLIVLLMSRATYLCPKSSTPDVPQTANGIDTSISPSQILSDINPSATPLTATEATGEGNPEILPGQRRLAEITELIHTASLLHDDVIDHSVSRRGNPSANLEFGNKMAVLAGDFLLGRASVALARLRNAEVVELLATVIANLVEGEFMQLKNTERDERNPQWSEETVTYYLQKTYLKTASLISKSCRAAALLGNSDAMTVEAAYSYGRNLGLAFQLVDDLLDYTQSGQDLGKPAGADLELGLATAPLLFAWKQTPELGALVGRKFEQEGDVARARELVLRSDGIEQTRALAHDYIDKAISAISGFPDSEAKDGLIEMAQKTINRQK